MSPADIAALIRTVPDFPVPGVQFRDVTTLIAHGEGFSASIEWLAMEASRAHAQAIAGIEARGFIFGAAVAARLGIGFLPIRKPGKLPVPTLGMDYGLEYGRDRLELDPGAIRSGLRVVLIDDLIATGGTAHAAVQLLRQAGAAPALALFVIDLPELGGAARLTQEGLTTHSLLTFAGA